MKVTIVLFRNDFRTYDQPALYAAYQNSDQIIPVYIHDEAQKDNPGEASLAYLHYSLLSLDRDLRRHFDSQLVIRSGQLFEELEALIEEFSAEALYFGSCLDGLYSSTDVELMNLSCEAYMYNTRYLSEPHQLMTLKGETFKVFTPYFKSFLKTIQVRTVLPEVKKGKLLKLDESLKSLSVDDLALSPSLKWDQGFYESSTSGETAVQQMWQKFLDNGINRYSADRDLPSVNGVSRLSTALHFGEISPVQLWHESHNAQNSEEAANFRRQLIWRDFSVYCLEHYPQMMNDEYNAKFTPFPWDNEETKIEAWKKGKTGYPIIDAAMRELWITGIMHNRCRMIVASFLVKDLFIDWRIGMKWFEDTLIDADIPNNCFGWQWAAGCGLDAAPYFRIFNPWTQSQKFDPQGEYIRKWLPELKDVPAKDLHNPPNFKLAVKGYPAPIVKHNEARDKALAIYKTL